ncbi:hypothetical protein ACFX11_030026 [Malus domestica]
MDGRPRNATVGMGVPFMYSCGTWRRMVAVVKETYKMNSSIVAMVVVVAAMVVVTDHPAYRESALETLINNDVGK